MAATILSIPLVSPGQNRVKKACPWCKLLIRIKVRSTKECRCGALHRWNGSTIYHIPSLGQRKS